MPEHCDKQMLLLGISKSLEGNWCWKYYCDVCETLKLIKIPLEELDDIAFDLELKRCRNCNNWFEPKHTDMYCNEIQCQKKKGVRGRRKNV
jgi:hypothetical protein